MRGRPDQVLRDPRPRPVAARTERRLRFAWEPFSAIADELPPLFVEHWRELDEHRDDIALDPDWNRFFLGEAHRTLHILTARERRSRELVGYIFNSIGPHSHHRSTYFASTDGFWLDPGSRQGWEPVRFLLENLAGLRERKVKVHYLAIKLHWHAERMDRLLRRLGYKPVEVIYEQLLR
jgi:hypothetical protein